MTDPSPPTAPKTGTDDQRVRDHLANERTFLAWTRTGISMMGFGVVIAKLRYLFPAAALTPPVRGIIHASNVGLAFTVAGLLTVLFGTWRFRVIQQEIRTQRYQASPYLILAFSGITVFLAVLVIWYLLEGTTARP